MIALNYEGLKEKEAIAFTFLTQTHKTIKSNCSGGPWVAQSVKRLTLARVMISRFVSSSPAIRLCADSLEPASDSVSPSLSAPPLLLLCLSLKNKDEKRKKKYTLVHNSDGRWDCSKGVAGHIQLSQGWNTADS